LLHKFLAEALLDEADAVAAGAQRRALELEAAAALEEADEGGRAGELYESLRLLHKAAAAYERAGEIAKLELVLEVLDRHEELARQRRDLVQEIDRAIAQGQRRYAMSQLQEHVHGGSMARETRALQRAEGPLVGGVPGRPPAVPLVSRLQLLESKLLTRDRIDLDWGSGRLTRIRMGDRFTLGRAPDADLPLHGASLSRRHVELLLCPVDGRPQLCAVDLGSRVGSFWNGEALVAGEPMPIVEPGELACGMTAPVQVHPVRELSGAPVGGLLRSAGSPAWMLFVPRGGPLWLAPEIHVPARVFPDRGFVVLDLAPRVEARLHDEPLPPGANVELMLGDRLSLVAAPLTLEVLA
jgi:hypothetical protein